MLIAVVSACTEPEAQSAGATAHDQGGGSELSPLEEYLGEGAVSFEGGFGLSMDGSSTGGPFTRSDDQLKRR